MSRDVHYHALSNYKPLFYYQDVATYLYPKPDAGLTNLC